MIVLVVTRNDRWSAFLICLGLINVGSIGYLNNQGQSLLILKMETNTHACLSPTYILFTGHRSLLVNKNGKYGAEYDFGIMFYKKSAIGDTEIFNNKILLYIKSYYLLMIAGLR